MNPWTALLIGLVLGWLIEFAIDWFFWRRSTNEENDIEELHAQLQAAEARIAELEGDPTDSTGDEYSSDVSDDFDTELDAGDDQSDAGDLAAAAVTGAVIAEGVDQLSGEDPEIETADYMDEDFIIEESESGEDPMTSDDFEIDGTDELAAGAAAAVIASDDDGTVDEDETADIVEDDEPASEVDSDLVDEISITGDYEEVVEDAGEELPDPAEISQDLESEDLAASEEEVYSDQVGSFADDATVFAGENAGDPEIDESSQETDQTAEVPDSESEPAEEDFSESGETPGEGGSDQ